MKRAPCRQYFVDVNAPMRTALLHVRRWRASLAAAIEICVTRNAGRCVMSGLLLLNCVTSSVVAAPFARNFSTPGDQLTRAWAAVTDSLGNTYISGTFTGGSLAFGAVTLTRIGFVDAFVAKLDASGVVLWAKNFGGANAQTECRALAMEGSGYVYCGGFFKQGALTTPVLGQIGTNDAMVIKLDGGTGATIWAKNFGGDGAWTYGQALAVDGAGSVFLAGDFNSLTNLSTPAITRIGPNDAFVIKLNAATGSPTWARNFGGAGAEALGTGVSFRSGSVYLGGYFRNASLTTPALTRIGTWDGFAMKLDAATGNTTWAKNFGGPSALVRSSALIADVSGNAYLVGDFTGFALTTPFLPTVGTGGGDAFVIKLASGSGTPQWSKNFGGAGAGTGATAVALDDSGTVYVAGNFAHGSPTVPPLTQIGLFDSMVIKLDANTGSTTWAKNFGGPGADTSGLGVAADTAGNVYLGGFMGNANLTTPPLTKIGTNDAFIIKYPTVGPVPGTLTVSKSGSGAGTVSSAPGIDCGADCSEAYAASAPVTLTAIPAAGSKFVGWLGACAGSGSCGLTINGNSSVTAVFALSGTLLKYDLDRNNKSDALTDGLMILRSLFGLTGSAMVSSALASDATVTDPAAISAYLADIAPLIDVDGNGRTDAATDGLLILRYLFGLRGPSLTANAIGAGATRNGAQIEAFIQPAIAP